MDLNWPGKPAPETSSISGRKTTQDHVSDKDYDYDERDHDCDYDSDQVQDYDCYVVLMFRQLHRDHARHVGAASVSLPPPSPVNVFAGVHHIFRALLIWQGQLHRTAPPQRHTPYTWQTATATFCSQVGNLVSSPGVLSNPDCGNSA